MPADGVPLLKVEDLRVSFGRDEPRGTVVKGVSFTLHPGRCLGIVGESGSGKSVTARSIVGLAGLGGFVHAKTIAFNGHSLIGQADRQWRRIRGRHIGYILQDALTSLDQLRSVGREVGEGLELHGVTRSAAERDARVVELLTSVGLPDPAIKARQLPSELSGGQRQRALIASALALDPELLIADEPTTALDVTVQAQVLDLLEQTKARGKALILISHDLAVVSRMADEVIVMCNGDVVEQGPAAEIFARPRHGYTRRLIDAIPSAHRRGSRLAPASAPRLRVAEEVRPEAVASGPLLEASGLVKRFRGPDKILRTAVAGVSFALAQGETLGIVGESGSGKSTVARIVMALEEPDEGYVRLNGLPWTGIAERERRARRRFIAMVYQDPLSSFDPRWTIERIIADAIPDTEAHRPGRVSELLNLVSLPASHRGRRALDLSGGQRQRVAVARAVASRPNVIVCDEPVSALDVSVQAQILDLLGDLKRELGVSYLFISHDLGVVHHVSDRVLVMSGGEVVESGEADDVFLAPRHPYSRTLLAAVPRLPIAPAA
jgi:peptide/nickel transport system ATP-binding protein